MSIGAQSRAKSGKLHRLRRSTSVELGATSLVSAPAPPPLAPPPSSPSPALWRVPAWIVQMAGTPCRRMTE